MSFKIYGYLRLLCNIAYLIIGAFQGLMFLILFFVGIPREQQLAVFIMAIIPFLGYVNLYYARRMAYSRIYINEMGISNKLVTCKPIHISWDECVEIGLGKMPMGYGLYNVGIYFSKEPMPQKLRNEIQKIKLSDKHLWMQYDEKAMNEILKYVDQNKIIDYYLRPKAEE